MLDRDEDMLTTGGRHPFYAKYKVGFRPLVDIREEWYENKQANKTLLVTVNYV